MQLARTCFVALAVLLAAAAVAGLELHLSTAGPDDRVDAHELGFP